MGPANTGGQTLIKQWYKYLFANWGKFSERKNSIKMCSKGFCTRHRGQKRMPSSHIFVEEWHVRRCLLSQCAHKSFLNYILNQRPWSHSSYGYTSLFTRSHTISPHYSPTHMRRFTKLSIPFKACRGCATLMWLLTYVQKVI